MYVLIGILISGCVLSMLMFGTGLIWMGNAVRIARGASGRRVQWWLSRCGWALLIVAFISAAGAMLNVLAIPLFVVTGIILLVCLLWNRQSEARSLLWFIGRVLRYDVNVVQALRSYAAEHNDRLGRRATLAATRISAGVSLHLALSELVPPSDLHAKTALKLAQQLNLPPSRLLTHDDVDDSIQQSLLTMYQGGIYLVGLTTIGFGLWMYATNWVMTDILVTYREAFGKVPAISLHVFALAHWVMNDLLMLRGYDRGEALGMLGFYAVILLFVGILLFAMKQWNVLPSNLPLLSRFTRPLDRARLMQALAVVVEQQRPVSDVLSPLAQWHPKRWMRRAVAAAQGQIEQGRSWRESLAARGLLTASQCAILSSAERVGHLAWALRDQERVVRLRYARRLNVILHLAAMAAILLLGTLVLVGALSIFLALTHLAELHV